MLEKIKRRMFPITLSKGLDVVVEITHKGHKKPHWFNYPVKSLIEFLGDIPVAEVTPEQIQDWYDHISTVRSRRDPSKPLSRWTVDSYARAVKSYFNHLVTASHIDVSPARRLRLPKLPRKNRKDIPLKDIALMVQHSALYPRDNAIVLLLRDSGCRVGELCSIQSSSLNFENHDGQDGSEKLRGRAIVQDDKMMKTRFIYFEHDCAVALKNYLLVRPHNAPDTLFLSLRTGLALRRNGVYQMMRRIAKRAGVVRFNPHAFRHALAKHLLDQGAPPTVIKEILGHEDITTFMTMYTQYDDDELATMHSRYFDPKP